MIVPIKIRGLSKIALKMQANKSKSAAAVRTTRYGLRSARLPARQAVGGMP